VGVFCGEGCCGCHSLVGERFSVLVGGGGGGAEGSPLEGWSKWLIKDVESECRGS